MENEKFGGLRFQRKHTVRSLRSANKWKGYYEKTGWLCKVEKEGMAKYNVYIRRK